jgi:hypothetical protein
MSEQYDDLTDEDLDAIDRIVEGGLDRQHGEGLLQMWQERHERREQEDRALLDALFRAEPSGAEGEK